MSCKRQTFSIQWWIRTWCLQGRSCESLLLSAFPLLINETQTMPDERTSTLTFRRGRRRLTAGWDCWFLLLRTFCTEKIRQARCHEEDPEAESGESLERRESMLRVLFIRKEQRLRPMWILHSADHNLVQFTKSRPALKFLAGESIGSGWYSIRSKISTETHM